MFSAEGEKTGFQGQAGVAIAALWRGFLTKSSLERRF
jgi:hypothetical protein